MSKKRSSPSAGSLSLNTNFKFTSPNPEFIYNGQNYSDWLFNIKLVCDGIPILHAMIGGTAKRPDPSDIKHKPDGGGNDVSWSP